MNKVRVPLFKSPGKSVVVDLDGSGATLGKNLYDSSGHVITLKSLLAMLTVSSTGSGVSQALGSTDDLEEGKYNLYFKNSRVMHTPTYTDIDFTVPTNQQILWSVPIELGANADLIIDGDLVGVA
jgi:hypothetical protein